MSGRKNKDGLRVTPAEGGYGWVVVHDRPDGLTDRRGRTYDTRKQAREARLRIRARAVDVEDYMRGVLAAADYPS